MHRSPKWTAMSTRSIGILHALPPPHINRQACSKLTRHASITAGTRKACQRGDGCNNEVRGNSASAWRLCDDHNTKAWETEYGR